MAIEDKNRWSLILHEGPTISMALLCPVLASEPGSPQMVIFRPFTSHCVEYQVGQPIQMLEQFRGGGDNELAPSSPVYGTQSEAAKYVSRPFFRGHDYAQLRFAFNDFCRVGKNRIVGS